MDEISNEEKRESSATEAMDNAASSPSNIDRRPEQQRMSLQDEVGSVMEYESDDNKPSTPPEPLETIDDKERDVEIEEATLDQAVKDVLSNLVLDEDTTPKMVRDLVAERLGVVKLSKAARGRVRDLLDEFVQAKALPEPPSAEDLEQDSAQDLPQPSKKRLKRASDPSVSGQPTKPMSAYLFFAQEVRSQVKGDNPTMSFGDITKTIAKMWGALGDDQKEPYADKAVEARHKYEAEMKAWKEKSSDKPSTETVQSNPALKKKKLKKKMLTTNESSSDDDEALKSEKKLTHMDQVLLTMKSRRRKKEEISMEEIDVIVPDLLDRMKQAYVSDVRSHKEQKPATQKMSLLEEVIRQSTKQRMHEFLLDKGLLRRIRDWLLILPDGSLPNLTLRSRLYQLLDSLPVDEDYLTESEGLGKAVMALWKSNLETAKNKNLLRALIEKWSRPLFQAETDYRKLEEYDAQRRVRIQKRAHILRTAPEQTKVHYQSRHAKIPQKATFDYAIRPASSRVEPSEDVDVAAQASSTMEQSRQDRIQKKMESMQRKQKLKARALSVKLTKNH